MSSAERLLPQEDIIEHLDDGKDLIPHPAEVGDEKLSSILAEAIFLTDKPVRIRSSYGNIMDEIPAKEIEYVRTLYPVEEMYTFLLEQAERLSWADEIVIETMEK